MLKKALFGLAVLTIAPALVWIGYNSFAQASGDETPIILIEQQWSSPPEQQLDIVTSKTTKTIQGTPLPGGGCSVPGEGHRVSRDDPNGGYHGMITPVDPANCTYVETIEPGPGEMPVKPSAENPIQWQGSSVVVHIQ